MTDSPSSDAPGDGQAQRPQPWFPPGGGYSPGSPAPGQAPAGARTRPARNGPAWTALEWARLELASRIRPAGPGGASPGTGSRAMGSPAMARAAMGSRLRAARYGRAGPGAGSGPPPGQWPRYGEAAPKPGVIPLRPLGVGEILDGAFASIRRNPQAILGLAAVVMTISAIISATITRTLLNLGSLNLPSPGQQLTTAQATHLVGRVVAVAVPAFGLTVLLTFIVQAVLAGLLAPVIARAVGGQQISAGDAWRVTRPRLPSLLLAALLVLLTGLGPLLILGLIVAIAAAGRAPAAVYAMLVLLGLVALVLTIWFSTMLSLVTPVVVLENETPGPGPGAVLAAGDREFLAGVRHHAAGRDHRRHRGRHPAAPVHCPRRAVGQRHRRDRDHRHRRHRGRHRDPADHRRGDRPALRGHADA